MYTDADDRIPAAAAGGWTAVREGRPGYPLLRVGSASVDEGPPASVHEPIVRGRPITPEDVAGASTSLSQALRIGTGIMQHLNTSIYITSK